MLRARWFLAAVLCAAPLVSTPARSLTPEQTMISLRLGQTEELLDRARYREAGERALALRREALALPASPETRRLAVRAEVVAGTAALALGQEGYARQCFRRALQLEPWLELPDAAPKVRRTFDAVKETVR
jgi:hypothetical protein